MTRLLLRAGGALVLAAILVGPSAQAHVSHDRSQQGRPAYGHTSNEWLMMGRNCGASITPT